MTLFWRLLQFVRPYKWRAIATAFLGFLTIAANIGLMGSSGYLIASAALRPETVLLLWVPIVAVRFFGLSRGVFRYLERLASHDLTFRVLAQIRVWLYGRLESQAATLLETRRSADLLSSVVSDVEQLQNLYLRVLAPPAIACLTAALGFVILAQYQLALGVILVVMMVIGGIGIPWFSHRIGRRWGESDVHVRSQMYTEAADLISGLNELIAFGRADEAVEHFHRTQDELNGLKFKQNWLAAVSGGMMISFANMTMWFVLAYSIFAMSNGQINGVAIPTLVLVALACFEAVTPLPLTFQHYGQTMAASKRLFQLAEEKEVFDSTGNPFDRSCTLHSSSDIEGRLKITVQGLGFRYGNQENHALRNISFSLNPGKHMAIVGESGAGKSSILQVLLALRPYQEGSVRFGEEELRHLPEDWVREHFTVVSQQPYLFHASVADNLRMAKPDATMAELQVVVRSAQLHKTINGLSQGFDTIIGEWGTRFSGGERQRLALARALLRPSPIVLLDEPTTGLDPMTEQAFLATMKTELKTKTVLWITHRLSGLEHMDEILVLYQGSLLEQGTHQFLLKKDGYYRQLWALQKEQIKELHATNHIATTP